jgi:hypothetical protein
MWFLWGAAVLTAWMVVVSVALCAVTFRPTVAPLCSQDVEISRGYAI